MRDFQLVDLACEFLGLVQFARFALGAFGLELVELLQGDRRDFKALPRGQQKIAGIPGLHLHDIGFRAESRDVFN